MDDEEEKTKPVEEQSNDEKEENNNNNIKLPEEELELPNNAQQFHGFPEIDDSQLVGGGGLDDSQRVVVENTLVVEDMMDVNDDDDSNPNNVETEMDNEKNKTLIGEDLVIGNSRIVESPNDVMGDSELVGKPLVVEDMMDDDGDGGEKLVIQSPKIDDDEKLIRSPKIDESSKLGEKDLVVEEDMEEPKIVEEAKVERHEYMEDEKIVEEAKIVAEMEDSKQVEEAKIGEEMEDLKQVEEAKIVAEMEDSKQVESPNIVENMGDADAQVVGNTPVAEEMDGAKVEGDLVEMENSELVGGTAEAGDVDDSQVVGGSSPVVPAMDDSELAGGSLVVDESPLVEDEVTPLEEAVDMDEEEEEEEETDVAEVNTRGGRKRKRGGRAAKSPAKALSRKKTEEDVCFICFDGGDLVLCDRRGCPKAYHPACVNRDEAFFQTKGRWNCGWHICSQCEKAAQYMCYTCTHSLCKSCIKKAEFSRVRGNKGFCQACMRTVMLVEKNEQANNETAQADFDDKSSWELSLFKDYWIDLKGKLSLTLDDLTQARNPSKGVLARKEDSSDELYNANNDQGSNSDSGSEHLEISSSKKRKGKKKIKPSTKDVSPSAAIAASSNGISMRGDTEWASKELLEFVAHMKNGDTSILSQFDVQALLLDYIKRNDLRDPRRKSQIVCDTRLVNLFGKARVGHFEMLKLLESHFVLKEDVQAGEQEGNVDTEASQLDADDNSEVLTKSEKRRKTRKKGGRGRQTNIDDYAAIDVHNIKLVYLKRTLAEDLLEDMDTFHDKVVGSFVRIKITGTGQNQEMYRLVQVVGTGKASEPYETGKRTTDVMLEILNLNKTEIESIDRISSQEFSEDECKRLRQSIKCGLISRLTVGDIQEKAMALQAVRVNDWLEAEKLRLSHLRDRASDLGKRKELRECIEKLQLLDTPEERFRRLQEIPEVHTDPNMDPSYESEEEAEPEDKRRENYMRPRDAGFSRKGRGPVSPGKGGSNSNDSWSGSRINSTMASARGSWDNRGGVEGTNESSWSRGKDAQQSSSWEKSRNQVAASGLDSNSRSAQPVVRTESSLQTTPTALSIGVATSPSVSEEEKIWHYKDPSGKAQGPFSMVQLRKWSTTGFFPADLRIWGTTETQEDSIPLANALSGKFQKEVPQWDNFSTPQRAIPGSDNNRVNNLTGGWVGNNSSTNTDKSWSSNSKDTSVPANANSPLQIVKPTGTSYHGEKIDFQNPPTPTPGTSGGSWTNTGWNGQSPNHGGNGLQQAVNGPMKDAADWGGHSPTPVSGGRNSGVVSASFSIPDSMKPAEAVLNLLAANNNPVGIQGFVSSYPVPANPSMPTWNSSGNGYNNKSPGQSQGWRSDSAQAIPNIIVDPTHGGLNSQEWGAPIQKQELPAPSPTAPAQAGNYSNSGFSVVNSVQPPNAIWSPTPSTQNANSWRASQDMQTLPPPMAGGPHMQLPPMQTSAHMQPSPVPVGPYVQQPVVVSNQGWTQQGNGNMGWPPGQGNTNMAAWNAPQPQGNTTGAPQWLAANTTGRGGTPMPMNNMPGSQQTYDGNRYSSNRDRGGFHGGGGRDSNHTGGGGSRQSWNRQSSFSGGGGVRGGGSSRPPPKGQTKCKYVDSGTCRRGADCNYLHP